MNISLVHSALITDVRKAQGSPYEIIGEIVWSVINGLGRFIKELFFVLTYRCIQCGKSLEEHVSYGLDCQECQK